jgi:4-hydroxy-3-polyprenylbenzoate decarboxylase
MRTWIAELEAAGELIRIDKPVDPLTQMGSLLYQSREKALLFENLPHGWRSLGQAPANVRHAAIAFGATEETVIPLVAEKLGTRIPTVMVATGPVKEVKPATANSISPSFRFTSPGNATAPVIGSGLVVTRPDTGQRNLSFHRLQIKAGQVGHPVTRATVGKLRKYQARNEAMPVAIFIGHHPLYQVAAATTPPRADEFEIAAVFSARRRLVKCETVDLEVPADADALEGHVPALPRGGRPVLRIPGLLRHRHRKILSSISAYDAPSRRNLQEPAERIGNERLRVPQDPDELTIFRRLGRGWWSEPHNDGASGDLRRWCR